MVNHSELRKFLILSYDELEELNMEAKKRAVAQTSEDELRKHYINYLQDEPRIKAVTICFSDLEGRFHMLDYDKKFLINSYNNLTFDGSSVHGFSQVDQSDLKMAVDWGSFRWLPADIFGAGKVIVFANILDGEGQIYNSDMRALLKQYILDLHAQKGLLTNISVECEGFLLNGLNAEQNFDCKNGFELVSSGGYFNSLPNDKLKQFIDLFADAQRAMGFENEKDHPEVAPSQFELNYRYCNALQAADQLQLYKLLARQVAANMGMTASFLPKPVAGINGNGMHCNMSIAKEDKNLFYGQEKGKVSEMALDFINRILYSANDLSLVLNSSVNSYRRIDPQYEAPNQIKYSSNDRTSMIRIPLGNESTARIEVRTVAPDANPYMVFLSLLKTGFEGPQEQSSEAQGQKRSRTKFIPDNIADAIRHFKNSDLMHNVLGPEAKEKYLERKILVANRSAKELGSLVKESEIWFHHEVSNQFLWSRF